MKIEEIFESLADHSHKKYGSAVPSMKIGRSLRAYLAVI